MEFERDFVPGEGWREVNPRIARCVACVKKSFWNDGVLIHPRRVRFPEHNSDMPEAVLELYREASEVAAVSQRAACAILRSAFEEFFALLEGGNKESPGAGDRQFPEALRTVRVEGENAVTAGMIRSEGDNARTADLLCELLNLEVEYALSNQRRLSNLGNLLPHAPHESPSIVITDSGS